MRALTLPHSPRAGSFASNLQCASDLNSYAQSLLAPLVAKLGWGDAATDDPPLTVLLRSRVLSAASLFNLSSVVQEVIMNGSTYKRGCLWSWFEDVKSVLLHSHRRRLLSSMLALPRISCRISRCVFAALESCVHCVAMQHLSESPR